MKVGSVKPGDIILIYRTRTENTKAWFTSVATSICVVEEVKNRRDFSNMDEFMHYCKDYSVFTEDELVKYYQKLGNVFVIKMTYNIALRRRLNLKRLVEEVGIEKEQYWVFFPLSDPEFEKIIIKGDVYESLIID